MFPNLMKTIEAQQTLNAKKKRKRRKTHQGHMKIKLLKTSNKEIILKADKKYTTYSENKDIDYSKFLIRNNASQKGVSNIFKVLKLSIYISMPTENTFQKQK